MNRTFSCLILCSSCVCISPVSAEELQLSDSQSKDGVDRVERGIEYVRRGTTSVTLDWTRPRKPNGAAVLFVASDGWVSKSYDPTAWMKNQETVAGRLVTDGFAFAVIRHRTGGDYRVPDACADVCEAVKFVTTHAERFAIEPERIGVFGKSSGGHLALVAGTVPNDGDSNGN